MRANRSRHECLDRWIHDGSARRQRIGGGPGRRGKDQAVGFVCCDVFAVDAQCDVHDASQRRLVEDGVVECNLPPYDGAAAKNLRLEHYALAYPVIAREDLFENLVELILGYGRQEAHAAKIHGEDWHLAIRRQACCGKKCSVAAQHNQ